MECINCSQDIPTGAAFCGHCGVPQQSKTQHASSNDERCTECGQLLSPTATFCGSCGARRERSTFGEFPPARLLPPPQVTMSADGAMDLGFDFPTPMWAGLEPRCAGALEACESSIKHYWGDRELLLRSGYLAPRGGRLGMQAKQKTGYMRFATKLGAAAGRHAEGRSPEYLYRESDLTLTVANTPLRVIQMTYLREIKVHRYNKDVTTYPPASIANLLLAVVPGRIAGTYAANAETRGFIPHPNSPAIASLRTTLDSEILPVLQELWSMDFDVIGGDHFARADPPGMMTRRSATIADGQGSVEPIFSATLFQTDVLNPKVWYSENVGLKPSDLRMRELAMGLLPCGEFTLVAIQYPTYNVFDRAGPVVQTELRLDAVTWILERILTLVCLPEFRSGEEVASPERDLASYFQAVGSSRRRPSTGMHTHRPGENWLAGVQGQWFTEEAINQPVLPIEVAYRTITSGGP